MSGSTRTSPCTSAEARSRLATALAYLETAELVLSERERAEFLSVSAGAAVLAGIGASDAICCVRLGRRHRGEDHRGAASLLEQATPDGKNLAQCLLRLLDVKEAAHYGIVVISPRRARDAVKWANRLVERAREETER
jgi:hypothetical protein